MTTAADRSSQRIQGADGALIDMWVYRAAARGGAMTPAPAVVMAHGIGGVKAAGLDPFARAFAAAGHTCFVFDYRHWGASGGEPREVLSVPAQLADYRTVLQHARTAEGVDPERVFVWGTSFAGMHVVELAASEPYLAGAIAQCPLVDGLAGLLNVPPARGLRLMRQALLDRVGATRGAEPRYLPLIVGEGEFGVIATEDALLGQERLAPIDGSPWPNRITARSLLDVTFSRPVRRAGRAQCPMLLVVAEDDTMAPTAPAVRAAARAPRGELYRSRGGHYDVYAGGTDHDNVLAVELAFLERVGAQRV
ncbi:alpha/beta hydrolase [Nocardioides massiliensis]|uniref:Pimeloyl-ACP methyl ester carboxylesterase n=1 Tax=Nocardioides massiliensis TaxID=1325935 RepID=A0ABT9NN41_9ACTN|nr:alpha/beta fold hydrolase [Nocardioides massiliensis]MDP9821255.1 pimeloyl-ACP methyl ester carboxylesterase [Nocardioides massiliensis]